MSFQSATELANHLAATRPARDESFGDYMARAISRWPDLTGAVIDWACKRAAQMNRREARRRGAEADALQAKAAGSPRP